jgi:hypothetical protein
MLRLLVKCTERSTFQLMCDQIGGITTHGPGRFYAKLWQSAMALGSTLARSRERRLGRTGSTPAFSKSSFKGFPAKRC